MYSPDAILIRGNGSVLVGQEAIGKAFAKEAAHWPQMTVESDSLRVVGHTAWETGTTREREPGGGEATSHYLIVLRRGMKYWKINSLAVVPETIAADSASHQ
jgi:ketosteroid isomerase-like protein